jgi:hypothetical protein
MHIRTCVTSIAALLCSSLFTFNATAADAPTGRILFSRAITAIYNGVEVIDGTALFTIDEDGSQLSQLNAYQSTYFNDAGAESRPDLDDNGSYWMSKNFAPGGHRMLTFSGQAQTPAEVNPLSGKYLTLNDQGQQMITLFPGENDEATPGFGYVTWGPPGTNLIAYANSAGINPATAPACVNVMNPDGSNPHELWCAPSSTYPTTELQQIQGIRWSGNGKYLLLTMAYGGQIYGGAYYGGYYDIYEINISTGAATLVALQSNGVTADISYDGSEVVYEQYSQYCDNDDAGAYPYAPLCAQNTITGQTTVLEASSGASGQLLLSPDGTEVAVSEERTAPETDIYLVNTSTGTFRQITQQPSHPPSGWHAYWLGVSWSSDGSELLANRAYYASPKVVLPSKDIYVINVANATATHVTSGTAYDWYQPNW